LFIELNVLLLIYQIKNKHKMTTEKIKPNNIIDIPVIENYDLFERNRDKADAKNQDHCPCCGKAITNPRFFINSIYGGSAYPSDDQTIYDDAWVMGVGSECQKKFPEGYVYTIQIYKP
jgi:hypothetical protein